MRPVLGSTTCSPTLTLLSEPVSLRRTLWVGSSCYEPQHAHQPSRHFSPSAPRPRRIAARILLSWIGALGPIIGHAPLVGGGLAGGGGTGLPPPSDGFSAQAALRHRAAQQTAADDGETAGSFVYASRLAGPPAPFSLPPRARCPFTMALLNVRLAANYPRRPGLIVRW